MGELPELVVLLVPFPEHSVSAISDASVPPVALECVQVESNVVGHPYSTISISHILTLTPEHVFIISGGFLILSEQHLLTFSNSMAKSRIFLCATRVEQYPRWKGIRAFF